jgi:hypothetical protein
MMRKTILLTALTAALALASNFAYAGGKDSGKSETHSESSKNESSEASHNESSKNESSEPAHAESKSDNSSSGKRHTNDCIAGTIGCIDTK